MSNENTNLKISKLIIQYPQDSGGFINKEADIEVLSENIVGLYDIVDSPEVVNQKLAEALESYYTAEEVDGIFQKYYTAEEVEDKLENYVEKSNVSYMASKGTIPVRNDYAQLYVTTRPDGTVGAADTDAANRSYVQKYVATYSSVLYAHDFTVTGGKLRLIMNEGLRKASTVYRQIVLGNILSGYDTSPLVSMQLYISSTYRNIHSIAPVYDDNSNLTRVIIYYPTSPTSATALVSLPIDFSDTPSITKL